MELSSGLIKVSSKEKPKDSYQGLASASRFIALSRCIVETPITKHATTTVMSCQLFLLKVKKLLYLDSD